ncbi:unnamed protein product [Miscanthus lutarioriparius]|uniref:RING-type E3 ubiquitin transferase n=1 Tax=Miscanthus lutarioriparius TaxID=422564 RepID=A0A811SAB8_9POAL|nr:unnamed protein product [Miscanthus lutarioriparius]
MEGSSSSPGDGGGVFQVQVAVAVRGDGRASRRAARWAASSLVPAGGRVALVHVIPPVSFVPSPCKDHFTYRPPSPSPSSSPLGFKWQRPDVGLHDFSRCGEAGERVPVEKMEREVVEMYAQDCRARAQEVFLPFRRLVGRGGRTVDTVVLEGDSVAEALVKYAAESGVRSLVLGSATLSWFRRILRLQDVPFTVLKTVPSFCNIFVVSRRRLTIKIANQARNSKSNASIRIQSISHKAFDQIQRDWLQDKQALNNLADDEIPKYSGNSSSGSFSQVCSSLSTSSNAIKSSESHRRGFLGSLGRRTPGRERNNDFDAISQLKEVHYVALSSVEEYQHIDEEEKLRKELKDTLMMYDRACGNLAHAKKKIQLLSSECCEDVNKVQEALQREEMLKQTVADEKTKHLEAIGAVEMAKNAFTHETYSKHQAEILANMVSIENAKVVDALLSTVKSCRQYSKHEIELATDYFSDAKKIGEGGYGNVYRCTLDHTEVAVKVIQQDSTNKIDEFLREVEILSQLHHPNLVLLLGFVLKLDALYLVPEGLTEYRDTVIAGTLYYMDPEYQLTGTIRPKSDLFALGIIILQLLTGKRPHGLVSSVEEAIKRGILSDILDKSQPDWPIAEAEMLAKLGLWCTALKCRDRPNLESEVLPELENILSRVTVSFKLENILAPSHFFCPILQEIMEDPYVAADGHTYEHRAIKAWLEKYKISPVTNQRLPHLSIIPNHSLHAAIQQWKLRTS